MIERFKASGPERVNLKLVQFCKLNPVITWSKFQTCYRRRDHHYGILHGGLSGIEKGKKREEKNNSLVAF
jgi:hypothetical protein